MDNETSTNRKWFYALVEFLDYVEDVIALAQGAVITSLVAFLDRCRRRVRIWLFPESLPRNEYIQHLRLIKNSRYALNKTSLSFHDAFSCATGVPMYRLNHPDADENSMENEEGKNASSSADQKTVTVCSFSNDGSKFVICYSSGEICIWDTDHGTLVGETSMEDGPASNVSFFDGLNDILLICTKEYTCWKWETTDGNRNVVKMCDAEMVRRVDGKLSFQKSCFYENGTKIVFCTIMDNEERRTLNIECTDMTSGPPPCTPFDSIDSVPLRGNYVFSKIDMSGDGRGLLVGLMQEHMNDSYCILWPNIDEESCCHETLKSGTIGSWSIDDKYVVTWTISQESNLEDDTTSSAFLWNVDERRKNMNYVQHPFDPIKITNPFNENVFWSQLTLDIHKKPRLIMGIVGRRVRFLFWDIESKTHTHVIDTGISAKNMMVLNSDAWIESCVEKKNVKGLCPMTLSPNGSKFGGVLGCPAEVLVWDAHLGIEVLKVTPKDVQSNWLKGGINTLISLTSRKFALVGDNRAMVFCPSSPNGGKDREENVLEARMVELDNHHTRQMKDAIFKLCFSGDGDSLGVLCVGLQKMQVFDLIRGTSYTVDTTHSSGGSIRDFCLSNNGKYLATYKRHCIQIWDCKADVEDSMICTINIDNEVDTMGVNDNASEVLLCLKDGSITWYQVFKEDSNANEFYKRSFSGARSLNDDSLLEDDQKAWSQGSSTDIEQPLVIAETNNDRLPMGSTSIDIRSYPIQLKYKRHALTEGLEGSSFQVSPTFEQVIRVSNLRGYETWNLKTKEAIYDMPIDAHCIPTSSIHYSPSSSICERMHEELLFQKQNLFESTSITLSPQTTVVQSSKEHIVVASENPSSCLLNEDVLGSFDVQFRKEKTRGSHSVYVINLRTIKYTRRLIGKNLTPQRGLAISHDGRHVACLAGDFGSKVVVWNAYASHHLLPDYHSLILNHNTRSSKVIHEEILPMIDQFGVNFFSFPHPSAMSILDEAMCFSNVPVINAILRYALKKNIKVSFQCSKSPSVRDPISHYSNVVDAAIAGRSPKTLKVIMKYFQKRITHEVEVADILSHSMVQILQEYPHIFLRVIEGPEMLSYGHELEVSESSLEGCQFLAKTSNSPNLSKVEAVQFWKKELAEEQMESADPTILAKTFTIPISDACKISCEGVLHGLVTNKPHHSTFGSFAVQAIVDFKWKEFAGQLMRLEIIRHSLLLGAFMVYCFALCSDGMYKVEEQEGNEANSLTTMFSLLICWMIAAPCLYRELRQGILYVWNHGLGGFCIWLNSTWSWMEVLSYSNIVVAIPMLEFWVARKGKDSIILSVFAAAESLLLWCRVLYYARTTKQVGTFVAVISSVVAAVMPFLIIAFCVTFGFAVAFHVLYRHLGTGTSEQTENEEEVETFETLHKSFSTFGRTLFTVFGFVFGQFNLDDIYHAPNETTAIILFVLYMVVTSTTLLNMLIAIMNDQFRGIRDRERIRFVKARAMAVDDIESMMSLRMKQRVDAKIGKFLHVLMPAFGHEKIIQGSIPTSTEAREQVREAIRTELRRELSKLQDQLPRKSRFRRQTSQITSRHDRHPPRSIPEQEQANQRSTAIGEAADMSYESDSIASEFASSCSNKDSD